MSAEAWKDTGKCAECRRNQFCKKQCTANECRIRTIAKLSLAQVVGKRGIDVRKRDAENAWKRLYELRKSTGEDASQEQTDAMFERCRQLATHSIYSVQAIISGVAGTVNALGITTEESVSRMESQYGQAVAQSE